ncbi:MAG TPA: DNA-3-methyladenine glycosylase 2 family protein [Rhodospirillales bacterium]|nr:DNA-3-methyladenine glycosylase 2 family protein [Rhodospirillales bacterium]
MHHQAAFVDALADGAQRLAAADPVLAAVIDEVGPCRLAPAWSRSPFEALVRSVAYQQLQGAAAAAILARFVAMFDPPFPEPRGIAALDDAAMRAVGFSRAKIAAIRDIAAHTEAGVVPDRAEAESLDDATLIERLTPIRGVGPWTVQMLLIFTLGRLDVLPADDFGVRSGIRKAYGLEALPSRRDVLARGDDWHPFRTIASWYLWRAAEGNRARGQDAPPP